MMCSDTWFGVTLTGKPRFIRMFVLTSESLVSSRAVVRFVSLQNRCKTHFNDYPLCIITAVAVSFWNAATNTGNPIHSHMITQYVKQIKEEQAKARVLPRQAKPMFLSKVKSVSQYIMNQLQRSDISVREKFVLARDQALFKLQFFAGDRASDISNILTQELKELPDKSGFVFQHTFGKTLRGDRNINTFVVKRCADEHICPIRGLELYFSRARSWSVDLPMVIYFVQSLTVDSC